MPLTEIGEVELCGEKFKLGKNGKIVLVVEELDAWDRPVGKIVNLRNFLSPRYADQVVDPALAVVVVDRAQALLDLAGDLMQRLQNQRDARLGVGKEE